MLVSLKKVSRFHGNHLIFKDISFDIEEGSITLLAGANGAGKTSLLHILAGLTQPSTGSLTFGTSDKSRPSTGLIGHETFIYPEMSALDNLLFWCHMHKMPTDIKNCEKHLALVELLPFSREKAGTFSRGMAQRLSLARVFMLKPRLLLMDEPSTGLDSKSVKILYQCIADSKKNKAAIVWISHNLQADLPLADNVLLIEKKSMVFFGTAKDFTSKHMEDSQPAGGSMLAPSLAIFRKDLHLCFGKGSALAHSMLLGLLLIFIFSLSMGIGERITPRGAAAIFWISSAFCQVLIFNTLYSFEESSGQRQGLLLAPVPVQSVWLGKAIAGFCLLLCSQVVFLPAIIIFLGQSFAGDILAGAAMLLLVNMGCVTIGSLLGALSQGKNARESLLSIIIFPLLIPLFLAGINIGAGVFGLGQTADLSSWFGMLVAFDAIFAGAAIFLFPFMYSFE